MGHKTCVHQGGPKYIQQKFCPFSLCWTICILIVWGCVLWITIMTKKKIFNILKQQGDPGDIAVVTQLVEDWRTQPFVVLEVVEGGKYGGKCSSGFEPLFNREWKGTEKGCWIEDFGRCGDNCEVGNGEGFAETEYANDIRREYNSTHPNPFPHWGWGDHKRRGECIDI